MHQKIARYSRAPLGTGVFHQCLDRADAPQLEPMQNGMVIFWKNDRPIGHRLITSHGDFVSGETSRDAAISPIETTKAAAPLPTVCVVICTRNRPEELARCLTSFSEQSLKPVEIIVVDNASDGDATRLAADAAGVTYIREDRPGLDIARNAGAAAANSDIIAYTDDDVVLHTKWLEQLVSAFDRPDIMAVTGLVLPAELDTDAQFHFETFWSFGQGYARRDFLSSDCQGTKKAPFPAWKIGAGANMAFRRSVFETVGWFDERLDVGQAGCSGDSEFWYRILTSGFTCRYDPSAVNFHYHRKTHQGLSSQIFHYMRGHSAALLVQHERTGIKSNLRRVMLSLPKYYAKRCLRLPWQKKKAADLFLRQEIGGFLSGISFYLQTRIGGDRC